jgi:hypothetical protein
MLGGIYGRAYSIRSIIISNNLQSCTLFTDSTPTYTPQRRARTSLSNTLYRHYKDEIARYFFVGKHTYHTNHGRNICFHIIIGYLRKHCFSFFFMLIETIFQLKKLAMCTSLMNRLGIFLKKSISGIFIAKKNQWQLYQKKNSRHRFKIK